MTWMEEFRNELDQVVEQACLLRELADAAAIMGNRDLSSRLYGMAGQLATSAKTLDEMISKKVDADYTQAKEAFGKALGSTLSVLAKIGPEKTDADRKSV